MSSSTRLRVDSVIKTITECLAIVSAITLMVIMVAMLFDVIVRSSTGASTPGVYELVETLLIVAAFLGLAYAERSGGNVRVTIFLRWMPPLVARLATRLGTLIAVIILLWMVYATSMQAYESFSVGEVNLGIVSFPLWPSRMVIALGILAFLLEMIATLIRPTDNSELAPLSESAATEQSAPAITKEYSL